MRFAEWVNSERSSVTIWNDPSGRWSVQIGCILPPSRGKTLGEAMTRQFLLLDNNPEWAWTSDFLVLPPDTQAEPRQDGGAPMSDPKPQEALAGADGSATGTESRVCQDIALRQRRGVAKYGFTVDGNPLHLISWLRHAYEECLDQAVYLRRAIEEIEKSQDIQSSNTKQASKMKS